MQNKAFSNVYDFNFTSIDGKIIKLSDFKGKPIVIINTASLCGFTNQYSDIEKLFKNYADKDLTIIAVPSNDFGNQELSSNKEVKKFCNQIFSGKFKSSKNLILEEFLDGEEASYFLIVDKKKFLFMGSAQDHKRVGENETGPNTGGMGAYSPAPIINKELEKKNN